MTTRSDDKMFFVPSRPKLCTENPARNLSSFQLPKRVLLPQLETDLVLKRAQSRRWRIAGPIPIVAMAKLIQAAWEGAGRKLQHKLRDEICWGREREREREGPTAETKERPGSQSGTCILRSVLSALALTHTLPALLPAMEAIAARTAGSPDPTYGARPVPGHSFLSNNTQMTHSIISLSVIAHSVGRPVSFG